MKIIDRSIKIAHDLFPSLYANKKSYQAWHFSFLWQRSTLIAIGNNSYELNGRALYFANKFNVYDQKKYPSFHSEISAISKVWGKIHIDRSIKMINLRLNAKGELCNSKPCANCSIVINALGLKVWYSKEGKMYHLGD